MSEDERLAALEEKQRQQEAAYMALRSTIKVIDAKVTVTEARLNAVRTYQVALDAKLNALIQDMQARFHHLEHTMATKEDLQSLKVEMLNKMSAMEKQLLQALGESSEVVRTSNKVK